MTLYDKSLSTIQKVIEGKWKVYSRSSSGVDYEITYPEDWYMEFRNDRYIRDEYGKRDTVYFSWEKQVITGWMYPMYPMNLMAEYKYTTYMICKSVDDSDNNPCQYKCFFGSINNDTLDFIDQNFHYHVVRFKQK
jgi:hypothetical protein